MVMKLEDPIEKPPENDPSKVPRQSPPRMDPKSLFIPDDSVTKSTSSKPSSAMRQAINSVLAPEILAQRHREDFERIKQLFGPDPFGEQFFSLPESDLHLLGKLLAGLVLDFQMCDQFFRRHKMKLDSKRLSVDPVTRGFKKSATTKTKRKAARKTNANTEESTSDEETCSESSDDEDIDDVQPMDLEYVGLTSQEWMDSNIMYIGYLCKTALRLKEQVDSDLDLPNRHSKRQKSNSLLQEAVTTSILFNKSFFVFYKRSLRRKFKMHLLCKFFNVVLNCSHSPSFGHAF
jgi:hypothetical protein